MVIGDTTSRPNVGLNELDFIFKILVVGDIFNFTLVYLYVCCGLWAGHMRFSSNLRYQNLKDIDIILERGLSPMTFKISVCVQMLEQSWPKKEDA